MNLEEAKQALKNGNKLTHSTFRKFEFIELKRKNFLKKIQDETGTRYSWDEFWANKPGKIWEQGWKISTSQNEKETLQAKLRNQLSPIYSLSEICLELEKNPEKTDKIIKIIIELAKQTHICKPIIDDLLVLIDAENIELQEEIKSARDKKQKIFDLSQSHINYLRDKLNTLEAIVETKLLEKEK